jgi:hypothetical protein
MVGKTLMDASRPSRQGVTPVKRRRVRETWFPEKLKYFYANNLVASLNKTKDNFKMARIIRASFPSKCPMSGERIAPGDRICRYTPEQHIACINILVDTTPLPFDVCEVILDRDRKHHIGKWCKADTINCFTQTTKTGRVVKHYIDLLERKFVKGSGFVGCDTYDRKFNGDYYKEQEDVAKEIEEEEPATAEDDAFINDDEEEVVDTSDDESEEEEEWGGSDEEDDDEDWEESDDEDDE